jgi:DNA-binding MarR family transcriptional regulator
VVVTETGHPDAGLDVTCAERLVEVLLPLMRQLSVEAEAAGGDGLTMAQYRLLAALVRRAYSAGELAGHLGVAASTVSGLVAPLAKRGLVERGQDAADRRVVALSVTERGVDCYQRMEERVLLFLTGVFTGLAPETKEALLAGLNGLDRAIGRQRSAGQNGHAANYLPGAELSRLL